MLGEPKPRKRRILTEEHKRKISESQKAYYRKHPRGNQNWVSPCEAIGWRNEARRLRVERDWWKKKLWKEIRSRYVVDKPADDIMKIFEEQWRKERKKLYAQSRGKK